ncbi:MAG TPA: hypothetical protein VJT31_36125 [Rugosimonospora sp.]|nr:hypothetical protein [Rugosimonospora sp.]
MRRVLVPAVVLVLAAGCGGGGVTPLRWAGSVCAALKPWRDRISGLNAQAAREMTAAKTPSETRDNLLRLFAGARQASEQARVKVVAAGVPGVDGGRTIADRFAGSVAGVRDAYGKAHDTVQGLPLTPAKKFYDAVTAAIGTLNKEYAAAGLDTTRLASAELRKDFNEAPACTSG